MIELDELLFRWQQGENISQLSRSLGQSRQWLEEPDMTEKQVWRHLRRKGLKASYQSVNRFVQESGLTTGRSHQPHRRAGCGRGDITSS